MDTLNLSYSKWKEMKVFLATLGGGTIYYVESDNVYNLILVDLTAKFVYRHDLERTQSSANLIDFETTFKPTATLELSVDESIADEIQ